MLTISHLLIYFVHQLLLFILKKCYVCRPKIKVTEGSNENYISGCIRVIEI